MSTLHDIYDPPPAPVSLAPPLAERVNYQPGDVVILAVLALGVVSLAVWAYLYEPTIAYLSLLGGAVVIVESWSTAVGFLNKRPWIGAKDRWKMIVAALIPWLLGLGLAAALMMSLFWLSDWAG